MNDTSRCSDCGAELVPQLTHFPHVCDPNERLDRLAVRVAELEEARRSPQFDTSAVDGAYAALLDEIGGNACYKFDARLLRVVQVLPPREAAMLGAAVRVAQHAFTDIDFAAIRKVDADAARRVASKADVVIAELFALAERIAAGATSG